MTDHPQFQVPPPDPPDPSSEMILLESTRDYVVSTYGLIEQLQHSVTDLSRNVLALKAGVAAAITDIATLLGPLQAVIGDPTAANEIEVVIKNLNAVAKQLQSGA